MGLEWNRLRKFLTAEEIPRWFGLSLVLIYLVGLGSVAQYGIQQARKEGAGQFHRACRFSLKNLAVRLSHIEAGAVTESGLLGNHQRLLRQFAGAVSIQQLRLVDGRGRIVASLNPDDIGTLSPYVNLSKAIPSYNQLSGEPSFLNQNDLFYRVHLVRHTSHSSLVSVNASPVLELPDEEKTTSLSTPLFQRDLFLEAMIPPVPIGSTTSVLYARLLAIVLVVLGALFVIYRALRENMRGISKVAERLQHASSFEDHSLHELRIEDTVDGVTTAWNELIELVERLRMDGERSEANLELSKVLKNAGGGALMEAMHAVPDAILHLPGSQRFGYMNTAACRLFGWLAEDVKSSRVDEAESTGTGGQVLVILKKILGNGIGGEVRSEIIDCPEENSDRSSSYRVSVYPLKRGPQAGDCLVVVRDISQQCRADRAREEFITHVTHELRTPLTNIRAYTETLSSGMFDDPKIVSECYNVITKETNRLSRLIEDILSVSQLEVGTIILNFGSVNLTRLLTDSVRDIRNLAEEKNIDIQLVLPPKLEEIQGDLDKLAVVFINLLGNAVKYTGENGNIVVSCQMQEKAVMISVKDNGLGINPEDHLRIFEKFQRSSDPEVQNESGTGIGLFTAREIVRRHGGDIDLISEKGAGSTFIVKLPHTPSRAAVLSTTTGGKG